MSNHHRKWRLILGKDADPEEETALEGKETPIDEAVGALYESERDGGLGDSAPSVHRWLKDIHTYFPKPVVQIMQKDALDRLGLKQILEEEALMEALEPSVELVGTLLSLKNVIPDRTREAARRIVARLVKDLEERLRLKIEASVKGALSRSVRNRHPRLKEIDWHRTIRANLKHYQPELKALIPEVLHGFGRKKQSLRQVILLVDQSGSMADSLVYSGISASILASLRSIKTHFIVFDTAVADLTGQLEDPVDLLFGVQLGGGTDIGKALKYAGRLVEQPEDTILVLISDLYEGGRRADLLQAAGELTDRGVTFISLLALSDKGAPAFDKEIASWLARLDIPAFACTPDEFPPLMAAAIQRQDISQWASEKGIILQG